MDAPSTFYMGYYYIIKSQSHDPDTPTYTKALSGETADEHYRAMDDKIQSITRRDTWDIVSTRSVDDHNVLPGTWSFKCKI